MKQDLLRELFDGLGLDDEGRQILEDLDLMASYKYNDYEMYSPGIRFLDQLVTWLRQFDSQDRITALRLVRHRLIFISQREMQELARSLYYNQIVPALLQDIIEAERLDKYAYGRAFREFFPTYLRKSIFIGLSDGAKIDFFRRHHIELSQEQVIPYYRSSHADYLTSLRDDLGDPEARFSTVFLVDDFIASGYTLIHPDATEPSGYAGSLTRVYRMHQELIDYANNVYVCHYIATRKALDNGRTHTARLLGFQGKVRFLAALPLEKQYSVAPSSPRGSAEGERALNRSIAELCEKYYDENFETVNSRKGGSVKYGFGGVGLTLTTYSNTPNNSIYVLWLDKPPEGRSAGFQPLFRRIERHRQR